MSDQQQLRQRREALAQAVNSHDLEAVLSFIHPSYVGKSKRGFRIGGYQAIIRTAKHLFAPGSDYQETVEIEDIEVSGDSAKLVTRRIERMRVSNPKLFWIFLAMAMWTAVADLVGFVMERLDLWRAVVDFVFFLSFIWLAFYLGRRSHHKDARWQETWRMIDGRWLLVEEQQL